MDIYNELIMEHAVSSPYKKTLDNYDLEEMGHNPSCGDEIKLFIKLNKDKTIVEDISFIGNGCAISQSSTSIMIETLKGKKIEEVKEIINIFEKMIKREELTNEEINKLGGSKIFENIKNMPQRVKCALLSWKTLEDILK